MIETIENIAFVFGVILAVLGLFTAIMPLFEICVGALSFGRRREIVAVTHSWHGNQIATMPISLIVPAYNEGRTIVENIHSLLRLRYPNFEVIIVNDGSADDTVSKINEAFSLTEKKEIREPILKHSPINGIFYCEQEPKLIVVDKDNGGKADAINAGVNASTNPLVCVIDADTILETDALTKAVLPIASNPNTVIAVGGTIRPSNGCSVRLGRVRRLELPGNLLALFQVVEYIRAFLIARMAWSHLNAAPMISGAFGIFQRNALIEAGGFSADTVGEDIEVIFRLHRFFRDRKRPYHIAFVPDAVCWTEVPERLSVLSRQRRRWQRGSLETLYRHRRVLLNPKYGRFGLVSVPYLFVIDAVAPVSEALGYLLIPLFVAFGLLDVSYLLLFLMGQVGFGILCSMLAIAFEDFEFRYFPNSKTLLILFFASFCENFGYRQLLGCFRIWGYFEFLRKKKGWGKMARKGFS